MQSHFTNIGTPIIFPDGAIHTPLPDSIPTDQPIIRIRDAEGAIAALQLAQRYNILHIPYFPFTRNDHPPHSDLATFIRALDAQRQTPMTIVTYDPHSEALQLLIEQSNNLELYVRDQDLYNNVAHFTQSLHHEDAAPENRPILVATEKYIKFFSEAYTDIFSGYISCPKFLGQHLPHLDPEGHLLKPNNRFVIVDDICDTGTTVINIAKELDISKGKLNLYTSHAIFSEGTDELFEYYDSVATTNSFTLPEDSPDDRVIFYALYAQESQDTQEL